MKKPHLLLIVFGILFLFLIQSAGTLVESIYILDLMNSNLDEKALGVLFFFAPLLALPFYRKYPRPLFWILLCLLIIAHGLIPHLNTANRLTASGIATGASLSLLFLLITIKPGLALQGAAGLALAVALSTLLRSVGEGIEYTLTPLGAWVGWVFGLSLVVLLYLSNLKNHSAEQQTSGKPTAPILGIYLILTLVYFSFSAPAVLARWTEANYTLVVSAVSLLSLACLWLIINRPELPERISARLLILWNLFFTASLTATPLAHRVPFPPTPTSPAVAVGTPTWLQQLPLALTILLFPVLFFDMFVFLKRIQTNTTAARFTPGRLALGIFLGSLSLVILIFVNIFSNVWGYIEPISPIFRNTFWLSYFILSIGITLLIWRLHKSVQLPKQALTVSSRIAWTALLAAIFLVTLAFALPSKRLQLTGTDITSLRAMTFNTQQSNAENGEKSIDAQLALIRQVSPDILALQESDSTRISLNNNDYVRYFAEKLRYYSYYGPTPVTGTFGTAILSKYPLLNPRTVFIYSDKDETGVTEAEIEVDGIRFSIYNVHPDSSDTAMLVFAQTLVARSQEKPYVIALGDFNLRDYQEAYQVVDQVYTNAWVSVYPSEISPDGVDMSGDNRIDHIFLSPNLTAHNPQYILPPESTTDHPVHWTDITWLAP